MRIPLFISIIFFINGCTITQSDPDVSDRIAECNAGSRVEISGALTARISQDLSEDSELSASLANDIKGYFVNNAEVSEDNAVELYRMYAECIDRRFEAESRG